MGVFDIRGCGQHTPDGYFELYIEVLMSASAVGISRQNLMRGKKRIIVLLSMHDYSAISMLALGAA